jgi:hypothetical protein
MWKTNADFYFRFFSCSLDSRVRQRVYSLVHRGLCGGVSHSATIIIWGQPVTCRHLLNESRLGPSHPSMYARGTHGTQGEGIEQNKQKRREEGKSPVTTRTKYFREFYRYLLFCCKLQNILQFFSTHALSLCTTSKRL